MCLALVLDRVRFVLDARNFKQAHQVLVRPSAADAFRVQSQRSLRLGRDPSRARLDVHGSEKRNPLPIPLVLHLHGDLDITNVHDMLHRPLQRLLDLANVVNLLRVLSDVGIQLFKFSHSVHVKSLASGQFTVDFEHEIVNHFLHMTNKLKPKLGLLLQNFVDQSLRDLDLFTDGKFGLIQAFIDLFKSVFNFCVELFDLRFGRAIVGLKILNHFVLKVYLHASLVNFRLNLLDDLPGDRANLGFRELVKLVVDSHHDVPLNLVNVVLC